MRILTSLSLLAAITAGAFVAGGFVADNLPAFAQKASFLTTSDQDIALPEMITVSLDQAGSGHENIRVAKYEITVAQWQACIDADACSYRPKRRSYTKDSHPVSGVSWHDAQQYIQWLSSVKGVSYRLPLESEWRALAADVIAKNKPKKLFDDPRLAWAADYANFGKRAKRKTRPQGSHGTEGNGIADLAGNVWEWTQSCWRDPSGKQDPNLGENCGGVRILAGEHMTYQSEFVRVVPIGGCSIGYPPANIGFRIVQAV